MTPQTALAAAHAIEVPAKSPGSDLSRATPKKDPIRKPFDPFLAELGKFIKEDVVVHLMNGTILEGKFLAYSQPHMNVVIMTDTEKILIKQVAYVTRKRNARELPLAGGR